MNTTPTQLISFPPQLKNVVKSTHLSEWMYNWLLRSELQTSLDSVLHHGDERLISSHEVRLTVDLHDDGILLADRRSYQALRCWTTFQLRSFRPTQRLRLFF